MLKWLFLAHRYLGIALGFIMMLWCLSGVVMMYKPYPELSPTDSLALLPALHLDNCCQQAVSPRLDENRYRGFSIRMMGNIPVLELESGEGRLVTMDLYHGRIFHRVHEQYAQMLARQFADAQGYPGASFQESLFNDQWTVYGAYNIHRPLYRFSGDDPAGTQSYISSRTGDVIQMTTRSERIWGYLGAVIHWLYPTMLREKVGLWSQVVIWLTIAGIILTSTGLYFGFRQYRTRRNGRKSPYFGLSRWHHYAGLIFGLLTFTWVFSGLFSMNPWGLLEGEGYRQEQELLSGGLMPWSQIRELLPKFSQLAMPDDTVRLDGILLGGELNLIAYGKHGSKRRYSSQSLKQAPLEESQLAELSRLLSPKTAPLEAGIQRHEDSFYFNHHEDVVLPVYRVIASDTQTRYYLDPVTGQILNKVDNERKWYRWLFYGLHRGDFTSLLRSRPIWDIFMLVLLAGVTVVCTSGLLMGVRRLRPKR